MMGEGIWGGEGRTYAGVVSDTIWDERMDG